MKSMHTLLDEAEHQWRGEVRETFPLRSDTPVIRSTKQDGRDWFFSTDLQKIFATITNDASLQEKFNTVIKHYWDGDPETLARETLHYLLYHEIYHPIEAPFSVSGADNDNKKIHQAIRRGILKAEPELSPLEQVLKVHASQNGVKDFILDNRFALDNATHGYVRNDIIPTWDVLELQDAPTKTNFYTVTRLLYGLLYGPQKTHTLFEEKAGKEGSKIAEQALSALLEKPIHLRKDLLAKAKTLLGIASEHEAPVKDAIPAIRTVFAGADRYQGIERLMHVLGPYVEQGMPQARPDMHGEGAGVSPQDILQDLLDGMTPEEQETFVHGLEDEKPQMLETAAAQIQPTSTKPTQSTHDEMKNIDVLATHEFYKRNHPKVIIVGGKQVGESVVVGKQEYWDLQKTTDLTEDQLSKLNLRHIDTLQQRTRLPWLIDLGNGIYRLNEYTLKTRNVKDIVYVDAQIDVPDAVEFYLDSSGSMFGGTAGNFNVNNGSRWDMLSYVLYGFVDALHQGGQRTGKQTKLRLHNFANSQIDSELIPVDQFWNGDIPTLNILFKPNNGYDYEDLSIKNYRDGHKKAYVIVTDGNLVLEGRTEREARKMKDLAKDPQNHVVVFEIGGTYSLGEAVRRTSAITYHPVHDKEKMLQAGLEVLLAK